MFDLNYTQLPGVVEVCPKPYNDARGYVVKTFHQVAFRELGMPCEWAEFFYSRSYAGVLRGLHCQLPPYHLDKLIHVSMGSVLDAVIDLRAESDYFGQHILLKVSAENANMVFIPHGCAHGFLVLSEFAIVNYATTRIRETSHDHGIRWDSAGIPWPIKHPIISERDASLPELCDFVPPVWGTSCRSDFPE